MPTKNQKWSQVRNWNKKMITGAKGALLMIKNSKATTPSEWQEIELLLCYLDSMIDSWDKNNAESKADYLRKMGNMLRPTTSPALHTQIIGKGKCSNNLLDIAGGK